MFGMSEKIADTAALSVRIMLVEDNPGDVYLFEKSLQSRQIEYVLLLYMDGRHAMRAIIDGAFEVPDLILVDLNLPQRDGFDVLSTIRKDARLTGVPVGVLTSSDSAKDRRWAALHQVDRYITKPGTLEEFTTQVGSAVEELLTLSRQRRPNASLSTGD
jgi:two-component system, chemotaxis family, response regulator Rcp1